MNRSVISRLLKISCPRRRSSSHAPITVKVTISLSLASINFFKRAAEKNNTHYQKLIRRVLDLYAARYEENEEKTAGSQVETGCGAASPGRRKGRKSR